MAAGQAVWGIDVGKCALKAVRLRAVGEGKVELLASDYIPHAKILTQPDANREELIANALEKLLSRNDLSNDQVVVSVPGQHTLARFSKLPPVDEKKIPEIVRYEADQQIPFDIDEVIWDYQIFRKEDSPEIEVGIFAMKRELIREYLMHFEHAGIEPVQVQAAPLALYNAAAFDGQLGDETTIILDIGAENTDLVVATPHSLWTRSIPLGGNNFTDALVKSFKLSFSKAENLKHSAASSKYARQIFQSMRPIFADLVQELQRSIGFYTSTHREAKLTKCLAMGNAFKLPGLQKYLQQNLSLPVERPGSFGKLKGTPAASAPQFTEQLLSFGVAYGLALQGADQGSIGSSLLPSEIARQAVWRKKRPFFAAAAACLLLAAGVIWARQITDLGALQANQGRSVPPLDLARAADVIDNDLPGTTPDYEYAQTILAAGATLKREYQGLVAQGANEKQTVEQVLGLGRNRVVMLRLLDLIHQALPEPAAPLAEAKTPVEYLAAARQGPKRRSRNQVFIESVRIDYDPDVNEINLPDVSGLPVDELEFDAGLPTEGFIVTLKCRTPNRAGVKFVSDVFMPRLRERGRRPATGLCVNRVVLTRLNRLVEGETVDDSDRDAGRRGQDGSRRDDAGRTSRDGRSTRDGRSRSGGGSAFGGRGRGGGRRGGRGPRGPTTPTGNLAEATYYDPVTDESMDGDWLFVVEFDLRLHDAPEPEPEADTEEEAEPEPPDRD